MNMRGPGLRIVALLVPCALTLALAIATGLWEKINLPNLEENILPTRPRASLVLRKVA